MSANKKQDRKQQRKAKSESLTAIHRLPLSGFRSTYMPDATCLKFVYSDCRPVVASGAQGNYQYRLNSLFDPDFTGVGGQPDGFDLWKTLYASYRVVAVEVEIQAVSNADATTQGVALIAIAPSRDSAAFNSAEEVSGLRHAVSGVLSSAQPAKLRALWHIGQLAGVSDEVVLADPNYSALISANPGTQWYLHTEIETNATAGEVWQWTKITYYARMEQPITVLDSVTRHRNRFALRIAAAAAAAPALLPSSGTTRDRDVSAPAQTTPSARAAATRVAGTPAEQPRLGERVEKAAAVEPQKGDSCSELKEEVGELSRQLGQLARKLNTA